jgi:hypothetical protein
MHVHMHSGNALSHFQVHEDVQLHADVVDPVSAGRPLVQPPPVGGAAGALLIHHGLLPVGTYYYYYYYTGSSYQNDGWYP